MAKFPSIASFRYFAKRYNLPNPEGIETFVHVATVAKSMNCGTDAYFTKLGFSYARFKVMMNLLYKDDDGGLSPAALAEILDVKRATITGVLDTLEAEQLIVRLPDPNDRRGLLIRITDAGKEKLDAVLPTHYARVAKVIEHLTHEEQRLLTKLIIKFGEGVDAMERDMLKEEDKDPSGVETE